MFFGQDIRIEIQDSITEISRDLINSFQKIKKSGFTIEIDSVSSRVLSNQDQLFNSLSNQIFCLLNKSFYREREVCFPLIFGIIQKAQELLHHSAILRYSKPRSILV